MLINSQNNISYKGSISDILKPTDEGMQIITKPIDKVEGIVSNTVDSFIPEPRDEEEKHSHKTAIRVGSTVLVLSALIPLLNPKFSSKLINKMKTASAKYGNKSRKSDNFIGKLYKISEKGLSSCAKFLNFFNNFNSAKDELFKWICRKTKILEKPHNYITNQFDKISKNTVFRKYSNAKNSMDILNETILKHKSKLSDTDRKNLENIIKQINEQKEYCTKEKVAERLVLQEKLMSNLEKDTKDKIINYAKGFKSENKIQHVKDNMYFWAEDIIRPKRKKLESEGQKAVNDLIGGTANKKGLYNQALDIIFPVLNKDEQTMLTSLAENTAKKLNNANKSECTEYFDKKRDLLLGSAPTDILTALFGLTASGIAISNADSKEDKISRTITVAFPAIAGLGVSMGMTAMLYSGIKGMLIGAGSSTLLSLMGSKINKNFLKHNAMRTIENPQDTQNA